MTIGIDISQIVHEGTGVGQYVRKMVASLLEVDTQNTYVLFGASFRKRAMLTAFADSMKKAHQNVRCVLLPIPPTILEVLWNTFHIVPIQWMIGPIDVFWSSDWVQPPLGKAKGITTIHDVSFLRFPESFGKTALDVKQGRIAANIPVVQLRRLRHAFRACSVFLCDSLATKNDVMHFFHIDGNALRVVYPGFSQ